MSDNVSFLNGTVTTGDALQQGKASVQTLEILDSREVLGGLAMLGDEPRVLVGFEVCDNVGGPPLE